MNESADNFDHSYHFSAVVVHNKFIGVWPTNFSCNECHAAQSPKTASSVKDCLHCHKEDMFPGGITKENQNLRLAPSFREAMHRLCVDCHKAEAARLQKPNLGDCWTCHETLKARPIAEPSVAGDKMQSEGI